MSSDNSEAHLPFHHKKLDYCYTRKAYRKGKRSTAVKVFTVNVESKYIIVTNVHATGLEQDLIKTFSKYGTVVQCEELKDYPKEPFTQVFLLKFSNIQSARIAKRKTDEMYFFGSTLHVFYAPEYETVEDARSKLNQRRASVIARMKSLAKEVHQSSFKDGKDQATDDVLSSVGPSSKSIAKGNFVGMSTTNIQSTINVALPISRVSRDPKIAVTPPSSLKEPIHSTSHGAQTDGTSRIARQKWHPPKKKPRLIHHPAYVPPQKASLPP